MDYRERAIIIDGERKRAYAHAHYEANRVRVLGQQAGCAKKYQKTEVGKRNKLANAHRMIAKYPEKYRARYILRNAVRLGHIIKGKCEACGSPDVESHHDDYSKPLDVRWFCRQHHCELEGRWIPRN